MNTYKGILMGGSNENCYETRVTLIGDLESSVTSRAGMQLRRVHEVTDRIVLETRDNDYEFKLISTEPMNLEERITLLRSGETVDEIVRNALTLNMGGAA